MGERLNRKYEKKSRHDTRNKDDSSNNRQVENIEKFISKISHSLLM